MPGIASFQHAKALFAALPTIVTIEGSNADYTFCLKASRVTIPNATANTIYLGTHSKNTHLQSPHPFILCTYKGIKREFSARALGVDLFKSLYQKIQNGTEALTPVEKEALIHLLIINVGEETTAFIDTSNSKLKKTGFSLSVVKPSNNRVIDNKGNVFYLHHLDKHFDCSFVQSDGVNYAHIEQLYYHQIEDGNRIQQGLLVENEINERFILELDESNPSTSIDDTGTEIDTCSQDEDPLPPVIMRQLSPISAIPLTTLLAINHSRFLTAEHRIVIAEQCMAATDSFHKTKPKLTYNDVKRKLYQLVTQTMTNRAAKINLHKNIHPENFIVSFADPSQITVKLEPCHDNQNLSIKFYNQTLYDCYQVASPITHTLDSNNYALGINIRDILSPISPDQIKDLDGIHEPQLQKILSDCENLLGTRLIPEQNNSYPDQLLCERIDLLKDFKTPFELDNNTISSIDLKATINAAIKAYQSEIKAHSWFTSGFTLLSCHGKQGIDNTTVLQENINHKNCCDINNIKKQLGYFFNLNRWVDGSAPNANNHSFISFLMNELKQFDPAQVKLLKLGKHVNLDAKIDYCHNDMKAIRKIFMKSLVTLSQTTIPPNIAIPTGLATVHSANHEGHYRRVDDHTSTSTLTASE